MSLIQAALDKTTQTQTPDSSRTTFRPRQTARIWRNAVLEEGLEKELKDVQRHYNAQRLFWWKVAAGIIVLVLAVSWPLFNRGFSILTSKGPRQTAAAVIAVPRSLAPVPIAAGGYRLSGIMDLGDKPRAIVNDQIVAVGDTVSKDGLVKEIKAGEVLLAVHGKEIRLRM